MQMLYGKTFLIVTIWKPFFGDRCENFQTKHSYGDICHHMNAWSEKNCENKKCAFIPIWWLVWNVFKWWHIQMVTFSNWYENPYIISNGDTVKWWHFSFHLKIIIFFKWWQLQMVTFLVWNEKNTKVGNFIPLLIWMFFHTTTIESMKSWCHEVMTGIMHRRKHEIISHLKSSHQVLSSSQSWAWA